MPRSLWIATLFPLLLWHSVGQAQDPSSHRSPQVPEPSASQPTSQRPQSSPTQASSAKTPQAGITVIDPSKGIHTVLGLAGDGLTDDSEVIRAAVARLPASGGQIVLPQARIRIATTVTDGGKPVIFRGSGIGTILAGSGIAILRLTHAWSGVENLRITDPIGNDSTIGILIDNGSSYTAHWHITDVSLIGTHLSGVGIKLVAALTGTIENSSAEGLKIGLSYNGAYRIGSNAVHLVGGWYGGNHVGVSVPENSAADVWLSGVVVENNTIGLQNASAKVTISASHFEGNRTDVWLLHGGSIASFGSSFLTSSRIEREVTGIAWISHADIHNAIANDCTACTARLYNTQGAVVSGAGVTIADDHAGITGLNTGKQIYRWSGFSAYEFDKAVTTYGPGFSVVRPGNVSMTLTSTGGANGALLLFTDGIVPQSWDIGMNRVGRTGNFEIYNQTRRTLDLSLSQADGKLTLGEYGGKGSAAACFDAQGRLYRASGPTCP